MDLQQTIFLPHPCIPYTCRQEVFYWEILGQRERAGYGSPMPLHKFEEILMRAHVVDVGHAPYSISPILGNFRHT